MKAPKTQQQPYDPHSNKQKNIKPSLNTIQQKYMTKMSQGNKMITT